MNLNAPCFDSVLAIDAQLAKLQSEVSQMDSEFGNYKPPALNKAAAMNNSSSSASPEIIEEGGRKVTFKEPTSRSILKQEQKYQQKNNTNRDTAAQQAIIGSTRVLVPNTTNKGTYSIANNASAS